MALQSEFINIIIPIENIERVYQGGFDAYKVEHEKEFTGRMYHDQFLFRDGAMSLQDTQDIIDKWEALGLVPLKIVDGKEHWNELCVVFMLTGLIRPCDWVMYNSQYGCVHLKGQPPTPVISNR